MPEDPAMVIAMVMEFALYDSSNFFNDFSRNKRANYVTDINQLSHNTRRGESGLMESASAAGPSGHGVQFPV